MHVRLTLNGLTSSRIRVGDFPDEIAGYVNTLATTMAVRLVGSGRRPDGFDIVQLRDLYTEVVLSAVLSAVIEGQPAEVAGSAILPIPIRVDSSTTAPTPPQELSPTLRFIYAISAGFWKFPSLELATPGSHPHTLWATDFRLAPKESSVGRLQRSLKIPTFKLWLTCGTRDEGFFKPQAADADALHVLFCERNTKILAEPCL